MTNKHMRAGVSALRRTWAAMHLHWRAFMAARARRDDHADASDRALTARVRHERHLQWCTLTAARSRRSPTWAAMRLRWRALMAACSRRNDDADACDHRLRELLRIERPLLRRLAYVGAAFAGFVLVGSGLLWWRLTSGPLSLDLATPWLTSAVEERLGGGHRIQVGGTQLERDDDGRTALRLRDIVVRDRDGAVIASAPKAEVGLSGTSLLAGHVQATRLSLIGAQMAVRVDPDGQINVFAGAEQRPIAAAPVINAIPQASIITGSTPAQPAARENSSPAQNSLAALLAWFDSLDALGFDGRELTEVGLKSGSLRVDDGRNGKRWNFDNINFSLTRPREGGVAFALTSTGADGPWSMTATVAPRAGGRRAIEAVVRDLSPRDVL